MGEVMPIICDDDVDKVGKIAQPPGWAVAGISLRNRRRGVPHREQYLEIRQRVHLPVVPLLAAGSVEIRPGNPGAKMANSQFFEQFNCPRDRLIILKVEPLADAEAIGRETGWPVNRYW